MEEIIGSITGATGHTVDIVYDIFVTTERIIFVSIHHPADEKMDSAWLSQVFLGSKLGKMTRRIEEMEKHKVIVDPRAVTQGKTPDELLSLHQYNFSLSPNEIVRAEFKGSRLKIYAKRSSGQEFEVKYDLPRDQTPIARQLFEQLIKSKVRSV